MGIKTPRIRDAHLHERFDVLLKSLIDFSTGVYQPPKNTGLKSLYISLYDAYIHDGYIGRRSPPSNPDEPKHG